MVERRRSGVATTLLAVLVVVVVLVGALGYSLATSAERAASGSTSAASLKASTVTSTVTSTTTSTATETIMVYPVTSTSVSTLTSEITSMVQYTKFATSQAESTITTSIASQSGMVLPPYVSSSVFSFFLTPGVLYITVASNTTIDFLLTDSALWSDYQDGQAIPVCFTNDCDLSTSGANPAITNGTLQFLIPSSGTYYLEFSNDYTTNIATAGFSVTAWVASQQLVTYMIVVTTSSTTTFVSQTYTTLTNTTYSTTTIG